MKTPNELLREIYQINLDTAEQGKAIAEKHNDEELFKKFKEDASVWKTKLENLKD